MKPQTGKQWSLTLLFIILAAAVMASGNSNMTGAMEASNKFETVRAHIEAWLSATSTDKLLMSQSSLKETIVDDWNDQKDKYQIVSVRKPEDYSNTGHIPHAKNIYWVDIANEDCLAQLDSNKKLILYCYYGHGSMLSCTILSLLGYECCSLNFGMMGWNLEVLVKEPWDRKADYAVELAVNRSKESYPFPVISIEESDVRSVIKEMARKYLSGEGSPVIVSPDVKAIVDDWDRKKAEYQIIDVRSSAEYKKGHIPHAINIPWAKIAGTKNLKKLDPGKTVIIYSENGQTGQLATTALSLLGYKAVDIKFGMMDWNSRYVEGSKLWAGAAGYPVEKGN